MYCGDDVCTGRESLVFLVSYQISDNAGRWDYESSLISKDLFRVTPENNLSFDTFTLVFTTSTRVLLANESCLLLSQLLPALTPLFPSVYLLILQSSSALSKVVYILWACGINF